MSRLRDCPVCGKGFLKGKRCYVPTRDGRLIRKQVCLGCSSKAERIVVRVSAEPCMVPECSDLARICTHHHAADLVEVRSGAVADAAKAIRTMIVAMKLTQKRVDADSAYLDGQVAGLESALEVLVRKGVKKDD